MVGPPDKADFPAKCSLFAARPHPTSGASRALPRRRAAERGARSRPNRGKRMSQPQQSAVRNRLLAALAPDDFAALAPVPRPIELEFRQVLHEPGRPIQAAYFLEGGMVSMLVPLEDGKFMEVGLVGREGMVGLPIVLGDGTMTTEAIVQMEGSALRVRPAELRAAFERNAG